MTPMQFQLILFIIFLGVLTFFLIKKRKKIDFEWILKPIIYFALYKTKAGIKQMDAFAKKHNKFVKRFFFVMMILGFIGIFVMTFLIVYTGVKYLLNPQGVAGAALVLPIPIKGVFYVPFMYWIISIFVLAVVHEFSHGLVARAYNIPVKSSGFAFLGIIFPIIPAAFVEPDEKKIKNSDLKAKLSIFSAGPMINVVFGILFFVLFLLCSMPLNNSGLNYAFGLDKTGFVNGSSVIVYNYSFFEDENIVSPARIIGIPLNGTIEYIDDYPIRSIKDVENVLENKTPHEMITVVVNGDRYAFELMEDPETGKTVMGVMLKQEYNFVEQTLPLHLYNFLLTLLFWLYLLNVGVGTFNLLPIGALDGGQMLLSFFEKIMPKKKARTIFLMISRSLLILIILMVLIPMFI